MLAHMRERHTNSNNHIDIYVNIPGNKQKIYQLPDNAKVRKKLNSFLNDLNEDEIAKWEQATPWEELAKERIEKYKKAGIVLRGARYREGISQKALSLATGISQDNISKIENGKRTVGEKIAKKLAKALNFDYRMLLI